MIMQDPYLQFVIWPQKVKAQNNSLSNFDPHGLPLIPGLIEVIETGDPLALR